MTHKEFQINTPQGGTNVHFNLDFNGTESQIFAVAVHSNFDSDLPHSPSLEWNQDLGKWMLARYYDKDINGVSTRFREFYDSTLSNQIVERIMEIKEEETPKFT